MDNIDSVLMADLLYAFSEKTSHTLHHIFSSLNTKETPNLMELQEFTRNIYGAIDGEIGFIYSK